MASVLSGGGMASRRMVERKLWLAEMKLAAAGSLREGGGGGCGAARPAAAAEEEEEEAVVAVASVESRRRGHLPELRWLETPPGLE